MITSEICLTGLKLPLDLGTYGPDDVVPDAHFLDLRLGIDPALVIVAQDSMEQIFDYDPLIKELETLCRAQHYETQEWLMTRIAKTCAQYHEIQSASIHLYKGPVLDGTGQLGMRVTLDRAELERLR